MSRFRTQVFLLFLMLAFPCSLQAKEITISAASSLTNAFTEIAQLFTQETGIDVQLNFASSNTLLRQLENGAPADIFASADQETMDKAEAGKHVAPHLRQNFARNSLVLITPSDRQELQSLTDLTHPSVKRIAIGKPETVPAGRYARTALLHHDLWDKLSPVFVFGNNVRQVLSYVKLGEADAGFVYRTDALTVKESARIVTTVEPCIPICYPVAVTRFGADKKESRLFFSFLFTEKSSLILQKYGFIPYTPASSDAHTQTSE